MNLLNINPQCASWLRLFCKNDLNAELDRCYRLLFIGKLIVRVREASNARSLAFNGIGGVGIATHGFFLPNADRDVDRKYKVGENLLLRSGLALAGANRKVDLANSTVEDGIFTPYKAMSYSEPLS